MNKFINAMVVFVVMFTGSLASAQQARVSPLDAASGVIDGNRVMIVYSRPFSKDPNGSEIRKIWGSLVPYGQVWRFGANEATIIITQQPITLGGATVPAGAHTLFMLPQENGPTKLIINKAVAQAGTDYDEKQDLARVDMTKSALPEQVNQLTIAITPNASGGGGTLAVKWEKTQFAVPVAVKK